MPPRCGDGACWYRPTDCIRPRVRRSWSSIFGRLALRMQRLTRFAAKALSSRTRSRRGAIRPPRQSPEATRPPNPRASIWPARWSLGSHPRAGSHRLQSAETSRSPVMGRIASSASGEGLNGLSLVLSFTRLVDARLLAGHIGRKLTRDPAPERLHFRSIGKL